MISNLIKEFHGDSYLKKLIFEVIDRFTDTLFSRFDKERQDSDRTNHYRKMSTKNMVTNNWETLIPYFKQVKVAAKTVLLREGDVSKTMYFIDEGSLRTWVNNDGKEITTQFFFEGDSVSSIESFRTNRPSLYSIETIEPCTLQTLTQKDFNTIIEQSPKINKQFEEHLFNRLFQAQQLFFSYLKIRHKSVMKN